MKKLLPIVVLIVIGFLGSNLVNSVKAQSYGVVGIGPIATVVTSCPPGVANMAMLCPVGSGTTFQMYVSYNGGAYAPLVSTGTAGVTSFNGRTGAVTLTKADVTGTGLTASTTVSISAPTGTASTTLQ